MDLNNYLRAVQNTGNNSNQTNGNPNNTNRNNNTGNNNNQGNNRNGNQGNNRTNNQRNNRTNNHHDNHQHNHNGNHNRNAAQPVYVGAPYNFIAISKNIYDPTEVDSTMSGSGRVTPSHDVLSSELYTGQIKYKLTAKTDIAVGGIKNNDTVRCYRTAEDNLAIPGSSVRGMVKSNAMLLSFASFKDDIADYKLMYRELAHGGKLKNKYSKILGIKPKDINKTKMSLPENVKAGYLVCKEGKYLIYGTKNDEKKGTNYYAVSEKFISENSGNFKYIYSDKFKHSLQYKEGTKFVRRGRTYDAEKSENFKGKQNGDYIPFYEKVSFNTNSDSRVVWIGAPDDNKGHYKGCIVGTGPMPRKKALYLFDGIDLKNYISIDDESINSYKIDYNNKKKTLSKDDKKLKEEMTKYFDLPKEGEEPRPVFYINLGKNKIYFGYTPNLRIFYDYSIHDGLKQIEKSTDMVREMFGYADNDSSFKSRVSFSEAIVWNNSIRETGVQSYVLGGPKASSYLDYIQQSENDTMTYNDKEFELRGVKQYWIRNQAVQNGTVVREDNGNDNVKSKFTAVPRGSVFEGTVRFHNLTKEELGLLLFSLELNPGESIQNIGKAKAFGYGAVNATIDRLERYDCEKAYSLDSFEVNPYLDLTSKKDDIVKSFKEMILNWYNCVHSESNNTVEEIPNLKDFFTMKRVTAVDNDIRYMILDEYKKNKREPLPTVNDYKDRWNY